MALCPPSLLPIAQGDPGSPSLAIGELFFPFLKLSPIGCIGGRYNISKPISAIRGRIRSQSLNVPCRPSSSDVDRGKNSYQALNNANCLSTFNGRGVLLLTISASCSPYIRSETVWLNA